MSNNKVIKITVKGGMVELEDKIPEGIIVMVIDYDIDGVEDSKLSKDAEGKNCIVSIYDSTANKYKQL